MAEFFRVLVTGSRRWCDDALVHSLLDERLTEQGFITVIHGDCPTGADKFARTWAERAILLDMRQNFANIRHEPYPAYWNELGKSAGPIRNRYMVELGADVCLAFPDAESRGTVSCMKFARAAGIPVLNYGTVEVF